MSRFENLSKELQHDSIQTISNVREAETLLQSEFEVYHEPQSIIRTTYDEHASGNKLDGRFRKGLLSGETGTLNDKYTDVDVKLLVSDKTLKYQADLRKNLGHRNPDPLTMFEQGEQCGYSSILQKYKHCYAAMIERPSSPENVEHIVNFIEFLQEETRIAKKGIIEGAKKGISEKLAIVQDSISDERALEGLLFLNEDYTIERRN